jgi:3-oxoacyl-(acyl-carrier-protein) synthase
MKRRRVKITGIGPVTPAGIGREAFWAGILESVSRVRVYREIGEEYGPLVAASVERFKLSNHLKPHVALRGAARHTLFAVAGTALALQDAGVEVEEVRESNCAIVTGTSVMDFGGIVRTADSVHKFGSKGAEGRVVFTTNVAGIAGSINQTFGLTARTMAVQSSCCSGLDAIGYAAGLVARGEVELAVCGGTEAPLHRMPLLELRAAGLTPNSSESPERVSRPFDLWRTTGIVSEGACMFLIEPESSRRPAYCFIDGYGCANDPPDDLCGGMSDAMKMAMADAGMGRDAVESISAWGPGHRQIDAAETIALARVFGDSLAQIPVVSLKGAIGTALGAAPAIQLAAASLGLRTGSMPPTVNWSYPDPACRLNLSNQPLTLAHGNAMVNSHGLAGVNSTMVLRQC